MESLDEEDKRRNRETVKKEAKLVIMAAKMAAFEHLNEELKGKGGDRKWYMLTKATEKRAHDLD